MIGKLKGIVENLFEDHLLININGICYIVYCSSKLLNQMQENQNVALFTHTMLKDEIPVMYGFEQHREKELFLLLTSVQGVGGKMAINIISEIDIINIVHAIQQENPKVFQQVNGVGTKIALRIINELKSNKRFFASYSNIHTIDESLSIKQDAISALVNLGFKKSTVISVVEQFLNESNEKNNLETIIKNCISNMTR